MRNIDPKTLHDLEEKAREIGRIIGQTVARIGSPGQPPQFGFALMLFSFNGPEATWISNGQRADMVKMLREFIARLEQGSADELSRPKGRG